MGIGKVVLWFFAFAGFWGVVAAKSKLPKAFALLIATCGIALFLYLCGLLEILLAGSWVLIAVGAGLAIWLFVRDPRVFYRWTG